MSQMFCFQCQQTAGNKCCVQTGVCGKQPETANLQDELVCGLIRLAETAGQQGARTEEISRLLIDGLFTTLIFSEVFAAPKLRCVCLLRRSENRASAA